VHWYRNVFSHVPSTKVREIAAMTAPHALRVKARKVCCTASQLTTNSAYQIRCYEILRLRKPSTIREWYFESDANV
jgi:hypothetical protein